MKMPQLVPAFLLALSTPLLAGCGGGGGGGGGSPTNPQATLISEAGIDGYVTADGVRNNSFQLVSGDQDRLSGDRRTRAFVSFDRTALPANAVIQSAVLRVFVLQVDGSPIASLGPVIVARVNIGTDLGASDYSGGLLTPNIGTLATTQAVGWRSLDVTQAVLDDISDGLTRSQFRLEQAIADGNMNGSDDAFLYESGDNAGNSGNLPQLVITYTTF